MSRNAPRPSPTASTRSSKAKRGAAASRQRPIHSASPKFHRFSRSGSPASLQAPLARTPASVPPQFPLSSPPTTCQRRHFRRGKSRRPRGDSHLTSYLACGGALRAYTPAAAYSRRALRGGALRSHCDSRRRLRDGAAWLEARLAAGAATDAAAHTTRCAAASSRREGASRLSPALPLARFPATTPAGRP